MVSGPSLQQTMMPCFGLPATQSVMATVQYFRGYRAKRNGIRLRRQGSSMSGTRPCRNSPTFSRTRQSLSQLASSQAVESDP